MNARGVEITGVGVCSAAGVGYEKLVKGIEEGRALFSELVTPLPVTLAGRVKDSVPAHPDFPDDRKAWLAFAALREALADAGGRDTLRVRPERCGVFLGTGLSSVTPSEIEDDLYPHLGPDGVFDRQAMARDLSSEHAAPRRHLPDRVTRSVQELLEVAGPTGTSFSACAAAAQAIAAGMQGIRRGELDVAIVGGHDSMIHPMGLLSFVVLGALAESRCRPFDRARSGFMIGEGAAILVLESSEFARQRGARSRARVLGAGTSADAWNATAPHPEGHGAALAMSRALQDAHIEPIQVDHVNAHGTGTPLGDRAEAMAIARVLGSDTCVSSVKGSIGHCIAAAGALETVISVASLERGFLPGTLGLEMVDEACPVRVLREPLAEAPRVVMSNSFGFGGQNCSLVLGTANA
jgi:3-oxoacyl-[acyl-carrier-protein] synthase II